jgi:mannose-6-phosphate isomerase-like protein (cupin superfamily)
MIEKVNLVHKFELFSEQWQPKIVGELNGSYVKVARLQGEFLWHQHAAEDELFLVIQGQLKIKLRNGEIQLEAGEFVIIPKGVEHQPVAEEEVQVLLLEPKSTRNTGDIESDRTISSTWI